MILDISTRERFIFLQFEGTQSRDAEDRGEKQIINKTTRNPMKDNVVERETTENGGFYEPVNVT